MLRTFAFSIPGITTLLSLTSTACKCRKEDESGYDGEFYTFMGQMPHQSTTSATKQSMKIIKLYERLGKRASLWAQKMYEAGHSDVCTALDATLTDRFVIAARVGRHNIKCRDKKKTYKTHITSASKDVFMQPITLT